MKSLLIGSTAGLAVFLIASLIIGTRAFNKIDFSLRGIKL